MTEGSGIAMIAWNTRGRRSRGFTLIELVVVMTIIALLAGAVTLNVVNRVKYARRARAFTDIRMIETALDLYAADNGNPPTNEQGIEALIRKPSANPAPQNWNGPYLKNRTTVPKDPWRSEYVYQCPGQLNPEGWDLISYGADGRPGGEDDNADLTNMEED